MQNKFLSKVYKTNQCWFWLGAKDTQGYGQLRFNNKMQKAHRVSWQLFNGEISNKLKVLHQCDNPSCVNPKHLKLGTSKDNTQDAIDRGTFINSITKTHCPKGHEYDAINTYLNPNTNIKHCRECMREASKQWKQTNKEHCNELKRQSRARLKVKI